MLKEALREAQLTVELDAEGNTRIKLEGVLSANRLDAVIAAMDKLIACTRMTGCIGDCESHLRMDVRVCCG